MVIISNVIKVVGQIIKSFADEFTKYKAETEEKFKVETKTTAKNTNQQSSKIEDKQINDNLAREKINKRRISKRKKRKESKLENKQGGLVSNLSKEDLVRGMVFKEILDKPRAKRPHKFPY